MESGDHSSLVVSQLRSSVTISLRTTRTFNTSHLFLRLAPYIEPNLTQTSPLDRNFSLVAHRVIEITNKINNSIFNDCFIFEPLYLSC
jgi:hypothetical protein